ncbi:MAG: hypothetical protein WCD86_12775 [Ktedonobacteraceae bacterium]
MTEEEFEQEVHFYRQAVVEALAHADPRFSWEQEAPDLIARFSALCQDDLPHFRRLCARLLEDEDERVRLGIIQLLQWCKIRDNILSMLLMHVALEQENLRKEALYALWRVGTRRVLPQFLQLADQGYSSALYIVRHLLRTPEEIEQGIVIARKYIDAQDYELREAALFLLQKYSSMEREAERVLAAVQKYLDELFIAALREAPPDIVLGPLKALRATIEAKYAEYGDLSATIQKLEQKKAAEEQQSGDRH